jgi:hypothetical protein
MQKAHSSKYYNEVVWPNLVINNQLKSMYATKSKQATQSPSFWHVCRWWWWWWCVCGFEISIFLNEYLKRQSPFRLLKKIYASTRKRVEQNCSGLANLNYWQSQMSQVRYPNWHLLVIIPSHHNGSYKYEWPPEPTVHQCKKPKLSSCHTI